MLDMRFVGGVLDGMVVPDEVMDFAVVRVPVKDGKWHNPEDQVVGEYEVYEPKNGDMRWTKTIGG